MSASRFEVAIAAIKRLQTCALDGRATGIDSVYAVFEPITNRRFVAMAIGE